MTKKRLIIFISAIFSIICLLCAVAVTVSASGGGIEKFRVDLLPDHSSAWEGCPDIIYADKQDNIYLSNATDITNLCVYFDCSGKVTWRGVGQTDEFSIKSGDTIDLSDCTYGANAYRAEFLVNGSVSKTVVFHKSGKVGAIYISTPNSIREIDEDKTAVYVDTIITGIDGSLEYTDYANEAQTSIKSRGNATWSYAKKAYNLKLSEDTAILGMKKANKWALIANYIDQSMIRNAIAYKLGANIGMEETPDFAYADLFIDGEYRGLYMVTEKVEVANHRVEINDLDKANAQANQGKNTDSLNINRYGSGKKEIDSTILSSFYYAAGYKSPDDITGGYLIELDDLYWSGELCRFTTNDTHRYVVKSPEYATIDEMKYISVLFAQAEEAVNSKTGYNSLGRHYSEYFDINSLAKAYVLAEVLKNWDGFYSSTFFYKDADKNGVTSKIIAGPVWDYDNSLGNINSGEFTNRTDDLWIADPSDGRNKSLATNLFSHPEFRAEISKVYAQVDRELTAMLKNGGYIDSLVDDIYSSVMNDYTVWEKSKKNRWPQNYGGGHVGSGFFQFRSTYNGNGDSAIGFLKKFTSQRNNDMRNILGGYEINTKTYKKITVADGLENKIDISCEYVAKGKRASLRAEASVIQKIVVCDADGNICKLTESCVDRYDKGIYVFKMPDTDVTVKYLPEYQYETDEESKYTDGTEKQTETDGSGIPTDTDKDSGNETDGEDTQNGKTGCGSAVCALAPIFLCGIVPALIKKRKENRK